MNEYLFENAQGWGGSPSRIHTHKEKKERKSIHRKNFYQWKLVQETLEDCLKINPQSKLRTMNELICEREREGARFGSILPVNTMSESARKYKKVQESAMAGPAQKTVADYLSIMPLDYITHKLAHGILSLIQGMTMGEVTKVRTEA